MARVTIEDCLEKVVNRFALSVAAMRRSRQLIQGVKPLAERTENKEIVTALREIAGEKIDVIYPAGYEEREK